MICSLARPRRIVGFLLSLVMLSAVDGRPARAEWPDRTIRFVVPFPPGGSPDALARLVAERLAVSLKQNVIVENRPGAGGTIGATQVARASPDGYTLLLAGLSTHVIGPLTKSETDFDPFKDFTHVAFIGGPAMVLIATPSADIGSIDDLVREAKAGRISTYTTLGAGTIGHLLMEYICQQNGIKLTHVPFTQVPVSEIITGRVPVGAFAWGAVLGQIEAKTVKAFAVGSEMRIEGHPAIATFKEQGFAFSPSTWVSLAAPVGTNPKIVKRLNDEVQNIMRDPQVRSRLAREASESKNLSPDELVALFENETAEWRQIVAKTGLRR